MKKLILIIALAASLAACFVTFHLPLYSEQNATFELPHTAPFYYLERF